ncbi:MAG: Stk1 family PASTA domain-containing Ser/Thr kinase [Lachnospiraceae bacterium]|nr:Stk1 family PASTA domain-containing Ser/Thr kinase [Lachnospiraceae bacterium]
MLKAGSVLGNRYEIVGRIGSGGMADVYKAKDGKLNRFVAVKVMKAEFKNSSDFVRKFTREAQSAAGLANQNIVNVFDVGDDNGVYYIVMELVEGITLKEYIEKKGKLSVREATSIAIQVCMGLSAAHTHGIIHRDVKPQNIIISTNGKVKVTDFGIARAATSNTISSNAMGSVHYSSPEQVRGGFADAKSDIYSLGITLYEMVTGRVPFDGDTTVAIAIKHLQDEMDSPSKYTPDLPYSLEQIIYKCTQKSADRRYASVDDVIEDLKRSLVEPNGHFVQLTPLSNHAQTIMISPAEMAAIKAGTAESENAPSGNTYNTSRVGAAPVQDVRSDLYDDADDDEDEDDYVRPRRDSRDKAGTRSGRQSRAARDDDDGISGGLEKAMTIGGFIVGAIIICILIFFIGRAAGLFHFNGEKKEPAQQPVIEQPEEQETPIEQPELIPVPSIIGLTEQEAQQVLVNMGLGLKYQGEEASDSVPEGCIVRQDPANGAQVEPNTTIYYYRSSGKATSPIPNVLGMSLSEAESQLSAAGFANINREQTASDSVPINCIIAVSPEPGTAVDPATPITLIVSTGPSPVAPPEEGPQQPATGEMVMLNSYTGLPEETAVNAARNLGLNVVIEHDYTTEIGLGEVIRQNPAGGTQVPTGSTVTFVINTEGAQAAPAVEEQPAPESLNNMEGAWVCNARLGAPENYLGGAYRITLEQKVNGESRESVVVEGNTISFPYSLKIKGVPGVSEGIVHLYEKVEGWPENDGYKLRANYEKGVTFKEP